MIRDITLDELGEEDTKGPIRRMLSDRYVHAKRVAQILAALSRYGFGRLGDQAARVKDLGQDVEERRELASERAAVRFRLLLESLGPTFIKLGQMLSTRPDLIDDEFAEELGNLRDEVPPFAFEEVRAVVEAELGRPLEELFGSLEEEPVASASIGQVHRAVEKATGTTVAVKVQRPGITGTIRADIEILKDLASVLRRTFRSIERFDPEGVVREFGHMIMREIDYTVEARNVQRFRENLSGLDGVHVPAVHFDLSTRRVLTMEFVEGVPIDRVGEPGGPQVDTSRLIDAIGTAYIKQIFVDGFFHADPHHGNLFVGPSGTVTFLDFGAVGYMDGDSRELALELYTAIIRGDEAKAAKALLRLCGSSSGAVDLKGLEWDLRDYIDFTALEHQGVALDRGMNQRTVTIALKHGLALPASYVLLERALLQVEGVVRGLDERFDMVDLARRNLPMLLRERLRPKREPLQALETARDYQELLRELPDRLDTVLTKLENDQLTVRVDIPVVEELRGQIRKAALMVSASLVALALIAYVAWAGLTVDIPVLQVSVGIPIIILAWVGVLVIIHRRW